MKIQLLVCAIFFWGVLLGPMDSPMAQNRDTPYDYPIRPGMEEWKSLKTAEGRYGACQIPESILSTLTTRALAKTCLDFPLLFEVNAGNTLQDGFRGVFKLFNGLQELFRRNDAGSSLIYIYNSMDTNNLENMNERQKGKLSFAFTYIELVISQDEIIRNITGEDREHLRDIAIRQYTEKQRHHDVFGPFGLSTTALVLGKLIKTSGQAPPLLPTFSSEELHIFLTTSRYRDESIFNEIFEAGKKL
ncbi:MAG: hypothetical protein JJU34_10170 [Lunatimonas sp.]|uniref:hypothetical protein n=1 Tax=Lunatimonas sp. TaxID=2060141 RepID=UPI00263B1FE8|nr:hypothetical protein [Lunatimonas sp.]MCC5937638.1 hypothetical protein [Lunatimonas sp.]